jgi:hypothetical protein
MNGFTKRSCKLRIQTVPIHPTNRLTDLLSTQPIHKGNFAKTIFKLAAVLGEVAHNVLELNVSLSGGVVPAEKRRRPLQQSKNDVGQELRKSKKG